MIGLIVSGHGMFATALSSSLKLIAGAPTNVEFVDFEENDSTESLKEKYLSALKSLDNCSEILALTDLAGGSPFKILVEISCDYSKKMEVIGGANIPMLIEISMVRDSFLDVSSLCESALSIGKDSIVKFALVFHKEIECEDGI